ncbi:MAG: hypothetical protein AAF492_33570, partial [Verrucomicrobiota bacterium]
MNREHHRHPGEEVGLLVELGQELWPQTVARHGNIHLPLGQGPQPRFGAPTFANRHSKARVRRLEGHDKVAHQRHHARRSVETDSAPLLIRTRADR